MKCTFFGHRNAPGEIQASLEAVLVELIERYGVDTFYVGNHGNFDAMVRRLLKRMRRRYPHIQYAVVLAYLPEQVREGEDYTDTLFPEGLEKTPRKYAILKRNDWMIDHSDYVVTYVWRTFGGAAKFKAVALKKGKNVIEIAKQ